MSIANIFGIAGSALNAQQVRMNVTASNLANAGTTASTEGDAFKAKRVVFQTMLEKEQSGGGTPNTGGVKIEKIIDDTSPASKIYEPSHPQADAKGYLYKANVNEVTEMVEMMDAARSFQNNVEVVNTARDLMVRTIDTIKN